MKILGIDPGILNVGIAVIEFKSELTTSIITCTVNTNKSQALENRLQYIVKNIIDVIHIHNPSYLAIEEIFVNKNPQSSLKLAQSRGAIIYAAHDLGLKIMEMSPKEIKKNITGTGKAQKEQIIYMTKALIKDANPNNDHEADALACAYAAIAIAKSQ